MPLLQIFADYANCGDQFGKSVLVFEYWAIIGDPNYDTDIEICPVTH